MPLRLYHWKLDKTRRWQTEIYLCPLDKSKWHQKRVNINRLWRKLNYVWRWSEYIITPKFLPFFHAKRCQENARKPPIWPVWISQSGTKMRTLNRVWPKSNQIWNLSGYISIPNWGPFLLWAVKKVLGNLKFDKVASKSGNQQTMTWTYFYHGTAEDSLGNSLLHQ